MNSIFNIMNISFRNISIYSSYFLSTDDFQSSSPLSQNEMCTITFNSGIGGPLIVSTTKYIMFSHRQPKNLQEIVLRDANHEYHIEGEETAYRLLDSPLWINMPMNLNFRSLLVISVVVPCTKGTFQCNHACHKDGKSNCSSTCLPSTLLCDMQDNCMDDEKHCRNEYEKKRPHSSFRYDQSVPSSSQLMLIGIFILNGSFIVFFLILSLCSVGTCFSNRMYRGQTRASRMTFLKYLREASAPSVENKISLPPEILPHTSLHKPRPSILTRINFEPSPTLKELEPEVEDRNITPSEELCSPPTHLPEVFLRRQSLPNHNYPLYANRKWKRASVGGGYI